MMDDIMAKYGITPVGEPTVDPIMAKYGITPVQAAPLQGSVMQYQGDYNPAEGMPKWQLLMAGLGKFLHDTGQSYQGAMAELQAAGIHLPFGMEGMPMSKELAAQAAAAIRQQTDDDKRRDQPLLDTPEGEAGQLWGQLGSAGLVPMARGAGLLGRLAGGAATGGAIGALQPVGTDDSRGTNIAVSAGLGAAGQGAAETLGAIVRPAGVSANPSLQQAAQFAAANDTPLTRGQMTGNTFVQRMERMLASSPGAQAWYKNVAAKQGELADNVVKEITGGDAGAQMTAHGRGKAVTLDPEFFQDMSGLPDRVASVPAAAQPRSALQAAAQYAAGNLEPNPALAALGPAARAQAVQQGVPEFIGGSKAVFKPGDTIPMSGPQDDMNNYGALRSLFGGKAFNTSDAAEGAVYGGMRDAFDNAAFRSLEQQGFDPSQLAKLRAAYSVDKTLGGAKITLPDGSTQYDLQKVGRLLDSKLKNQPNYLNNLPGDAGNTLSQLANFARNVKPINSSGTAENQVAAKVVGLDLLKDVITGNPAGAVKSAIGMIGGLTIAPKIVNTALQGTRNGVPWLRDLPPEVLRALGQGAAILPPVLGPQRLGQAATTLQQLGMIGQ